MKDISCARRKERSVQFYEKANYMSCVVCRLPIRVVDVTYGSICLLVYFNDAMNLLHVHIGEKIGKIGTAENNFRIWGILRTG